LEGHVLWGGKTDRRRWPDWKEVIPIGDDNLAWMRWVIERHQAVIRGMQRERVAIRIGKEPAVACSSGGQH
jgi:hypothetical protein